MDIDYYGDYNEESLYIFYSCEVNNRVPAITFEGVNDINVTSIYGVHVPGRNDLSVEALGMPHQKLKYFPGNIGHFFPNLKAIHLSNNAIVNLSYDDLKPFNLTYIDFGSNQLTNLDSNLFDSSPNLSIISFFNNKIRSVGENIKISSNATAVFFGRNECINMSAFNTEDIAILKSNLLLNCSPITPPTSPPVELQCPQSCSTLLTNLIENNLQLEARVAFLEEAINSLAIKWTSK